MAFGSYIRKRRDFVAWIGLGGAETSSVKRFSGPTHWREAGRRPFSSRIWLEGTRPGVSPRRVLPGPETLKAEDACALSSREASWRYY